MLRLNFNVKNVALVASGIVFAIIAYMHFVRYYFHWSVDIQQNLTIPIESSIFGCIAYGLLAIWMFIAALKK